MTLHGISRYSYETESNSLSSGGEGEIYKVVGTDKYLVKIYHANVINSELESKIKLMAQHQPSPHILDQVAWPLDVLYDSNYHFVGFLMPKLDVTTELSSIYVYPPTKLTANLAYHEKIIIAQNICTVINAVHEAGYIFGDFNPHNIGVNLTNGHVAFFDTDSYHIVLDEKNNKAYRCNVCLDGYVAPELLKKCESYIKDAYATAPLPTFTKETDEFALAIHIFRLLMNGFTPFNGIKDNSSASTASPGIGNQAIKRDNYCFKPGNKPQSVAVPSIEILPDALKQLFTRAFIDGKTAPSKRPPASEWFNALDGYINSLKVCTRNKLHSYKNSLTSCPWCRADIEYKNQLDRALHPSKPVNSASLSTSSTIGKTNPQISFSAKQPINTQNQAQPTNTNPQRIQSTNTSSNQSISGTPASNLNIWNSSTTKNTAQAQRTQSPNTKQSNTLNSVFSSKSTNAQSTENTASNKKKKSRNPVTKIVLVTLCIIVGLYSINFIPFSKSKTNGVAVLKSAKNSVSETNDILTGEIEIKSVDTNSWIVGKKDKNAYTPDKMLDRNENTSYQFSTKDISLDDEYIIFEFSKASTINKLKIKNGSWKKDDKHNHYKRNSRIKKMKIEYMCTDDRDYSVAKTVTLKDDGTDNGWKEIDLGKIENVEKIRIRVLEIYKGTTYPNDVCVSEIMFAYEPK